LALLFADENFPNPTVEALRQLGHDVVTVAEVGMAGLGIPDEDVLACAHSAGRAILTHNRKHFRKLVCNTARQTCERTTSFHRKKWQHFSSKKLPNVAIGADARETTKPNSTLALRQNFPSQLSAHTQSARATRKNSPDRTRETKPDPGTEPTAPNQTGRRFLKMAEAFKRR
jgi:hypothetical protein